jgi:hypothetical protein
MPVLEQAAPSQVAAIRDAVSQLQMAYVRIGGQPPAPAASEPEGPAADAPPPEPAPAPGEPGPAQRSGRLWVPGQ